MILSCSLELPFLALSETCFGPEPFPLVIVKDLGLAPLQHELLASRYRSRFAEQM